MRKERGRGGAAANAAAVEPRERLAVKDPDGMHVLGRFFQAMLLNLLKDPHKVREAEGMDLVVAIDPPAHPDSALTLTLRRGGVTLETGIAPGAHLVLRCEPLVLMRLARVPAGLAAMRFLGTREGKDLVGRVRSGELRIKGISRHPLRMMRFSRFLAPSAA